MKRMSIRYFKGVFIAVIFLAIMGIQMESHAEDVMKIGVLGPLESSAGKGIRQASELAADEINAGGGILGKRVELVFADTAYKPDIGAYEYSRMVKQDKVVAVLGTASSSVALDVMKQMARLKVPFLPTGSTSPKVTDQVKKNYDKNKYLFRVCEGSLESAEATADWMINYFSKNHSLERAALMIESAVWTTPIAEEVERRLKQAGVEIPVFEYFNKQTKDFQPILSKIKKSGAELVFVVSGQVDSLQYVPAWAELEGPVMVGITASLSTIWKSSEGKVLSMVETILPGMVGLTERGKPFYDKYMKKYQSAPEFSSPYTYDAMYIFKAAAESAKSTEPDALVGALEKTDYNGIMGRWVFDKSSHHSKFGPGYRQMLMAQWQEPGTLCGIWPEKNKTCDFILPPWSKK